MQEIRPIKGKDFDKVVIIHQKAFSEFFLSQLGDNFLKLYYSSVSKNNNGVMLGCYEDNVLVAFAAVTKKSSGFHRSLIKHDLLKYFFAGTKLLLTQPRSIIRLLKNLSKRSSSDDKGDYAELLSIAVDPSCKHKGYGRKVLNAAEKILKDSGCEKLSLTTDVIDNKNTLLFYESMNFKVMTEFITYPNRKMLRLIKEL